MSVEPRGTGMDLENDLNAIEAMLSQSYSPSGCVRCGRHCRTTLGVEIQLCNTPAGRLRGVLVRIALPRQLIVGSTQSVVEDHQCGTELVSVADIEEER